jgi:hypothetical protein
MQLRLHIEGRREWPDSPQRAAAAESKSLNGIQPEDEGYNSKVTREKLGRFKIER